MFRMLLGAILLSGIAAPLLAEEERLVISNRPEEFAGAIFVGKDKEMPTTGEHYFAVRPTVSDDGEMVIPKSVSEALHEMVAMLPNWYLTALKTGRGYYECIVVLNNVDLNLFVQSWMIANWKLNDPRTELYQQLYKVNLEQPSDMANALHGALCEYARTNDEEAAMEVVTSFAAFKEEAMREIEREIEEENKKPGH